jgi:hypothetical protein
VTTKEPPTHRCIQLFNLEKQSMTKFAVFVRLEAKPGQEDAVAALLAGALPLANAELGTTAWFALRFGPSRLASSTPLRMRKAVKPTCAARSPPRWLLMQPPCSAPRRI